MVLSSVTSLSSNGLRDWLVQRISAVLLAIYSLFILGFVFSHPNLDFDTWHNLFANSWMKIFSVLVLLNLILHAWIGIWIVTTDYLKIFFLRLSVQVLVILALVIYFIWGTAILWGL